MKPPIDPDGLHGVSGEGWVRWRKKGLTFDNRPTLPVVTHDRKCFGKIDRFGGM